MQLPLKTIKNYLRKSGSALLPKMLMKFTTFDDCPNPECHYAEWHYAKCLGALNMLHP
jgi:hypothetical protein